MASLFVKRQYNTLNNIEISKEALLSNFNYFQKLSSKSYICPVLKGNAYGHGLTLVGKFVDKEIKPKFICVDSLFEAYELEKAGVKSEIMILGYTFPENFKYRKINFHLPVFDLKTLEILNRYQPGINVHIKIDTGMNRLGIKEDNIDNLVRSLKKLNRINVIGIYSHLSSADNPEAEKFTKEQILKFNKIIKHFESSGFSFKYKHINSTAGIIKNPDLEFNLSRIGLGFYGISPFPQKTIEHQNLVKYLKPALCFKSHIISLKKLKKGETLGYGRGYQAKEKKTVGIIPCGYFEGIDRRFSNQGCVKINNNFFNFIGNICMNICFIDLAGSKNDFLGKMVTIFDNNYSSSNSIYNSAKIINTIPYEILSKLNSSIKRTLI